MATLWMKKLSQALLSPPSRVTLCMAEGPWVWNSGTFAISHAYTCSLWQPGTVCAGVRKLAASSPALSALSVGSVCFRKSTAGGITVIQAELCLS